MNEEQVRAIVNEEIRNMLGNVYTAPVELVESVDVIASKKGYTKTADTEKTVASVTQAVSEAGTASYNVSKVPSGFISVTHNGASYNIPYFT